MALSAGGFVPQPSPTFAYRPLPPPYGGSAGLPALPGPAQGFGASAGRPLLLAEPQSVDAADNHSFYPSTTFRHTTVANTPVEDLITNIPWLQSILANDSNTINLPSGRFLLFDSPKKDISLNLRKFLGDYKLGFDAVVDQSNECNNAYNNSTGHCTLLYNCNHIVGKNLLTSVDIYAKYFCNIDE